MSKRQTNTQFITKLMEQADTGPLMQGFIIEAISRYAAEFEGIEKEPKNWPQLISFQAWKACAIEVKTKLKEHLK